MKKDKRKQKESQDARVSDDLCTTRSAVDDSSACYDASADEVSVNMSKQILYYKGDVLEDSIRPKTIV